MLLLEYALGDWIPIVYLTVPIVNRLLDYHAANDMRRQRQHANKSSLLSGTQLLDNGVDKCFRHGRWLVQERLQWRLPGRAGNFVRSILLCRAAMGV